MAQQKMTISFSLKEVESILNNYRSFIVAWLNRRASDVGEESVQKRIILDLARELKEYPEDYKVGQATLRVDR